MSRAFNAFLVGCAIVEDEGRILLLEQERVGKRVLNIPGGRVESGEAPAEAAIREIKEETGIEIRLTGLVGIIQGTWVDGGQFAKYVYAAEKVGGVEKVEKAHEVIHWVEPELILDPVKRIVPVFDLDEAALRAFVLQAKTLVIRSYRCVAGTFEVIPDVF